ncbi:MAG TPA: serine hydrolase domain-containing protein [Chthonomonadaceae bacterium]|nr:serine hydrolase domain-containing protein [Chthonomonadaceae bacterium]
MLCRYGNIALWGAALVFGLAVCSRAQTAPEGKPGEKRGHTGVADGKKEQRAGAATGSQEGKSADPAGEKVDRFIRQVMEATHIPGISLAVVRDGKVVKATAYGVANVDYQVPAKPETVYLLASITKTFTATAILMLVEEGKIGLDEKISRYLPDTPEAWSAITVRHLLTHTAGLKDRFEGRTPAEWLLNFTTDQMYQSARSQSLDFKPGEHWQYSDQGFFLLGMIIEKVTGKTYRQFLKERIFQPLGMTATTTISQFEIIPNLASGYTLDKGTLYHNNRRTDYGLVSHFGIVSNVLDMAKFDAALDTDRLVKRATLEQMWTPARLADGSEVRFQGAYSYGFGWFLSDFFGHRIIQHGGSTGTAFWRVPGDHLTVIVLTNLEQLAGGDATSIAKAISTLYVPGLSWAAQKPQPDPDPKWTEILKGELLRVAEGKPDVTLYTPDYGPAVRVATQASKGFYASIGPLKTLALLGGKSDGARHTLFYRADYRDMPIFYIVVLTKEGKIASLSGEPETLP